jgi:hypothetical protein
MAIDGGKAANELYLLNRVSGLHIQRLNDAHEHYSPRYEFCLDWIGEENMLQYNGAISDAMKSKVSDSIRAHVLETADEVTAYKLDPHNRTCPYCEGEDDMCTLCGDDYHSDECSSCSFEWPDVHVPPFTFILFLSQGRQRQVVVFCLCSVDND